MSMKTVFLDFENGEMCQPISDNMAMSSNGDLLMRMFDNMALNLETGDIDFISSWEEEDED